jgi:hypothetical protein
MLRRYGIFVSWTRNATWMYTPNPFQTSDARVEGVSAPLSCLDIPHDWSGFVYVHDAWLDVLLHIRSGTVLCTYGWPFLLVIPGFGLLNTEPHILIYETSCGCSFLVTSSFPGVLFSSRSRSRSLQSYLFPRSSDTTLGSYRKRGDWLNVSKHSMLT